MEYFMGETFNKEKNKPYKKLDAAEKAAEKQKAAVFDESGAVVKDFREKEEKPAEQPQTFTDTQVGTATPEEIAKAEEMITDTIDGVPAIRRTGKIRRVFNGSIRIRNAPSWDNEAAIGAAAFTEKEVTHVMEVDGQPMYKTLDGYFISGDPKLVEYIEE